MPSCFGEFFGRGKRQQGDGVQHGTKVIHHNHFRCSPAPVVKTTQFLVWPIISSGRRVCFPKSRRVPWARHRSNDRRELRSPHYRIHSDRACSRLCGRGRPWVDEPSSLDDHCGQPYKWTGKIFTGVHPWHGVLSMHVQWFCMHAGQTFQLIRVENSERTSQRCLDHLHSPGAVPK